MRWPWRRRRVDDSGNGHAARQAKADAEEAVRQARERWPEVHHAKNVFAEQVETAMARTRQTRRTQ